MLSGATGYDVSYYTDDGGVDYYTGAGGDPAGYWQGRGAAALGLSGKVDAEVMRRLYHEDVGPDGQVLARRQKPGKYPEASGSLHKRIEAEVDEHIRRANGIILPEEIRAIRLKLRSQWRNRVPFYDYTFSAPKSVSVLWASLLADAAEAMAEHREADAERLAEQAEQVRGAVRRANDRMVAIAERGTASGKHKVAYTRTGHHGSTSGQWLDADGLVVASFEQHTNRDGDMQLHVHNVIANRVQRADGADDKWRALHGQPFFKEKVGLSAYADRFLAQELELLGWRTEQRADGHGFEVAGISDDAADAFSARAKDTAARYRELEAEYVRDHGHAPAKRAAWALKQRAALETRDPKDHSVPVPGEEVAGWSRKAERRGAGQLSTLHNEADGAAAERGPSELPGGPERARAIRIAVAEVQRHNAVWNHSQLMFELGRALPALPADVDVQAYLDDLASEAVSGRADTIVLQVAPVPDVIDISRLPFRKDGTSIYRPPGEAKYVTKDHLDQEQWLVDVARMAVLERVTEADADAAVAGSELDWSQKATVKGLLTSKKFITTVVAPAGTGKTTTMGTFARAYTEATGGRVIGLTVSENAARELTKAGVPSVNTAKFLGKIKDSDATRGHMAVYPGDVVILDEATQSDTDTALRVAQILRQSGARLVMIGDTEQLTSVDAGGIFGLLAARHGHYRLEEVHRFREAWERDASLRLRAGDVSVMAEYAARGRVYHGHEARVHDDAVMLYLNSHLAGRETLLLTASNDEAARLAGMVRDRLIEHGRVADRADITLADGNPASTGDLIRARLNTTIDADGQTLANRDTIRLDGWQDSAYGRLAVVSRKTAPGEWSRQFLAPAAYLEKSAELDYAGNVHVAQGRDVDDSYEIVRPGMTRQQHHVGATRGRDTNVMLVVTGATDPAQPTREERERFAMAALTLKAAYRDAGLADAAADVNTRLPDRPTDRQMAPWEAVVAEVMQRDDPERTALEEIQAAQDFSTHTGHLLELYEAFWRLDVVPQIDDMIRERIPERDFARYMKDPERPAFLQSLRAHEIGGRPIPEVLDAITARSFTAAKSVAAVLHGRMGKKTAPVRGQTQGWTDRAPQQATAEITAAGRMLDQRQAALGEMAAERPQEWAVAAWGDPRAKTGAELADFVHRAGLVQSYREAAGITDPKQAIGPVPAGKAHLAEAFHASVRALELKDDQALLQAMGRGELEARFQAFARAEALAPRDVQQEIGDRQHGLAAAVANAADAMRAGNVKALDEAHAEAQDHESELSRLKVADAARREWTEANAGLVTQARDAAAELARRAPDVPPSPEREQDVRLDLDTWAQLKAEQSARVEADRQERAETSARACPVTEAEIEKYGQAAETDPSLAAEHDAKAEAEDIEVQDVDQADVQADDLGPLVPQVEVRQPDPAAEVGDMQADGPGDRDAAEIEEHHQADIIEPEPEAQAEADPGKDLEPIRSQSAVDWYIDYHDRHPELSDQPGERLDAAGPGPVGEVGEADADLKTDDVEVVAAREDVLAHEVDTIEARADEPQVHTAPVPEQAPDSGVSSGADSGMDAARDDAELDEVDQVEVPAADQETAPEIRAEVDEHQVAEHQADGQPQSSLEWWHEFEERAQEAERALDQERADAEAAGQPWPPERDHEPEPIHRAEAEEQHQAEVPAETVPEAEPEADDADVAAEIHDDIEAMRQQLADASAQADADQAEREEFYRADPGIRPAEPEVTAQATWEPGSGYDPAPEAEEELELG